VAGADATPFFNRNGRRITAVFAVRAARAGALFHPKGFRHGPTQGVESAPQLSQMRAVCSQPVEDWPLAVVLALYQAGRPTDSASPWRQGYLAGLVGAL